MARGRDAGKFTGKKISTINLDQKKFGWAILFPNAKLLDKLEVSTRFVAATRLINRELKDVLTDAGNMYIDNVHKKFDRPNTLNTRWQENIQPWTRYKGIKGGSQKIMQFSSTLRNSHRLVIKESGNEVAVFVGIPKSLSYPNGQKVVDVARRQENGYILRIGADKGKNSSGIRRFFYSALGIRLKKGKRYLRIKPGRPWREPALKAAIKQVNKKFKNSQLVIKGALIPR